MRNLFGLAPGGVYQAVTVTRYTGELLPFQAHTLRREPAAAGTFSPFPALRGWWFPFLWHFPSRYRDSGLRSTSPCGARTFLPVRSKYNGATTCTASAVYNEFLLLYNNFFIIKRNFASPGRREICFHSSDA